jgi:uncharacterized delta-60 repeat protein
MKNNLSLIFFLIQQFCSFAQLAGSIDSSFGNNGRYDYNLINSGINVYAVRQIDGKIIVFAGTDVINGAARVFRFLSDGSLDNSFGTNGLITLNSFVGSTFSSDELIIQPDGRILLHWISSTNNEYIHIIARLNSNGSIDNSFGNNGRVFINSENSDFGDFVLQNDNKILIQFSNQIDNVCGLKRFNSDGTIDNTFGLNGTLLFNFNVTSLNEMKLQADGKYLIVAYDYNTLNFILLRLNANFSLDNSFGTLGKTIIINSNQADSPSLKLLHNGKCLVKFNSSNIVSIFKFINNGTFDNSFGFNGHLEYTPPNSEFGNSCYYPLIQSDGRILVFGLVGDNNQAFNCILRLNENGTIDSTFGNNGIATSTVASMNNDSGFWSAVLTDNNTVTTFTGYIMDQFINTQKTVLQRFHLGNLLSNNIFKTTDKFVLYPNPTKKEVNISFNTNSKAVEILIYDLMGKQLAQYNISNNNRTININVSNFASGVYEVVIREEGIKVLQQKLIIE